MSKEIDKQNAGYSRNSIQTPCYVYSGDCRECNLGMPTGYVDINDKELFTGDILICFTEDYVVDNLTVMTAMQYTTYSDGTHEEHEEFSMFPMGIKDAWSGSKNDKWKVLKVKDWSDVVEGEHWKAYGFNYKST